MLKIAGDQRVLVECSECVRARHTAHWTERLHMQPYDMKVDPDEKDFGENKFEGT